MSEGVFGRDRCEVQESFRTYQRENYLHVHSLRLFSELHTINRLFQLRFWMKNVKMQKHPIAIFTQHRHVLSTVSVTCETAASK